MAMMDRRARCRDCQPLSDPAALFALSLGLNWEQFRVLNTCLYAGFCADRADREEARIC